MLAVVGLETLAAIYLAYLVYRKSDQIEGVTAVIYLEARKIPQPEPTPVTPTPR